MTNQVPWNKIILEEFINLALLTKDEEMINSIATAVQTVANGQNVLFPTDRVRTKSCQCACKGWLAHDVGSGLFTLTRMEKQ